MADDRDDEKLDRDTKVKIDAPFNEALRTLLNTPPPEADDKTPEREPAQRGPRRHR
ncbi:MAG: hypothetical protein ABSC56_06610 [Solirubrobacteraceae bacterium]